MKTKYFFFLALPLTITLSQGCKEKEPDPVDTGLTDEQIQTRILNDFASTLALPLYRDLENKMGVFYNSTVTLSSNTAAAELDAARTAWKSARGVWEQSEAFLFGPVATENIDPSTDTWPVDFNALDSLLASSVSFTQTYINSLGDELKGYHPAEYLLWGADGNKQPQDFTARELEFLVALSADLQLKSNKLRTGWDPALADDYSSQIINAGEASSVYPSQRAAFEEIVSAMAGICDEVANGKINEPFFAQDPSLEESPYSKNSLTDFRNNIVGVKNVYFGKYTADGYGIHDFLAKNNSSLHNTIAAQIQQALDGLDGITVPFGEAILTQPTQVQGSIDRINTLKTTLEEQLLPFLQLKINE